MLRKLTSWFSGLSKIGKAGVVIALLLVAGVAASPSGTQQQNNSAPKPKPAAESKKEAKADVVEKKTITEKQPIPFEKTTKEDATLEKGRSILDTVGMNGVRTLTYEITLKNGKQTNKKLKKEEVTTPPVNEVTRIGTKVAYTPPPAPAPAPQQANCHPNYTGACVPIASDVDCSGGSGNGPAYVSGPVSVIGADVYGLDRDGNGTGCE